ncbi:FidL-like protein [Rahnella laticis]|uniref:FidL-like protein n=1 Tax=Rahnella laticis TaxID=2787622 RepID=UPI0018A31BD7|nr:FidL-like protein [Rahnella laticis]MBF7997774.1 hypothetical protein [Rahnella laticis]
MNRRVKKVATWVVIAVTLMLIVFSLFLIPRTTKSVLPVMKCKVFSKISIEADEGELVFSIIENIQFYDHNNGLIEFEGYVKAGDQRTYLERTIHLKNGKKASKNAYVFAIDRIEHSDLDNTPEDRFNQMWLELAENDSVLNLGLQPVRDNVYIVSSPYSPQFTCVTY